MKINQILKKTSLVLTFALIISLLVSIIIPMSATAATTAAGTGYTSAEQVVYNKSGSYIYNWGAREEDCFFLSTYALNYYTGSYTYENLSEYSGGTSQSNAHSSALYSQLKSMMTSKHSYQTSYSATRELYQYTDCQKGGGKISSFYSGALIGPSWDSGSSWNREHTWPNSKGLGGNDENDIMMLRPTSVSENSSRGNTAYGKSSGYYNPNSESGGAYDLRGDCARIVLYVYTRWGNTSYMWGTSGVMENLNVLLEWMEEDPVDTWEMGRNDAVQSITGVRNVYVDYPEFAWLLFGQDVPENYISPSGNVDVERPTGGTTPTPTEDNTDEPTEPSFTPDVFPYNDGVAFKGELHLTDGDRYLLGEEGNKSYYISTTTSKSSGVDLYVEKVSGVDGAYRIYFMKNSAKTYIDAFEYQAGKGSLALTASPEYYYYYDADLGIFKYYKDDTNSYYLGTYTNSSGVTYDTVSCSNMSYITGSNESKIGVSQFPLYLVPVDSSVTPEVPTEKPTETPTEAPTEKPTEEDTEAPTEAPTEKPTENIPSSPGDGSSATIIFSEQGYSDAQDITSVQIGNVVNASFDKGSNKTPTRYYSNGSAVRIYGGNTVTFSANEGYTLTSIELTIGGGTNTISADVGSVSGYTWSGSADEVTFTISGSSGHIKVQTIDITYASASTTPETPTEKPSENVSEDISEDVSEDISEDVSENVSENVSEDVSEDVSEEATAPTTPDEPDEVPPSDPTVDLDPLLERVIFTFGSIASENYIGTRIDSYIATEEGFTLSITANGPLYKDIYDDEMCSALMLGDMDRTASMSFTVDNRVQYVVLWIAKFGPNNAIVKVNGTQYKIHDHYTSDDGLYYGILVDTSTQKTVTVETQEGGSRCLIDGIDFILGPSGDVEIPDAPVENVGYKGELDISTKVLYLLSETKANQSWYILTSEGFDNGVDLYVEETDGGYYLFFVKDGKRVYINMYERTAGEPGMGKGSIEFLDAPKNVYTYNEALGTLIYTSSDGNNVYCLGTYLNNGTTYETVSCMNTGYITESNLGATQFVLRLIENEDAPLPPANDTDVPTEDNTDEPTEDNTDEPTEDNTDEPTEDNTDEPTEDNTDEPSEGSTENPVEPQPTEPQPSEPTETTPTEPQPTVPTETTPTEPTEGATDINTEEQLPVNSEQATDEPASAPSVTPGADNIAIAMGCNSAVGFSCIAIVASISLAGAIVLKKRK